MEFIKTIENYGVNGAELRIKFFKENSLLIQNIAKYLSLCIEKGNKVIICGNGGSAADAQHFAAELVGRFLIERRPLPAIAVTVDSSILTAIGNDYGYDNVFERQVRALGKKGDILVAISTSGKSENVISAMKAAHEMGMNVLGMCGKSGGSMLNESDMILHVKSDYTPFIQEIHEASIHILCLLIDKYLFE